MRLVSTKLLLILSFFIAALTASAADIYARGVAYCILDDGSGTFPISEAGEVFVGTTPDETPSWAAGTHASSIITGPMTGVQATVKFYFWARARKGYTFLGWGSTKTSKSGTSGTDRLEGQAWESKTTLWSAGTATAPKELVRYAIFRKNAAEDTSGGGVTLSSITGNTHTFGSTTDEWPVHLNFAAPLAYHDFAGYADGYGTNKALIASITCTNKATGEDVTVKNAHISGSPTAAPIGSDAYGLIFFPADMPIGTYSVHVPKGLFSTASGSVTAATDFELVIMPDALPFTIESTTPVEGYGWDASEATQANETDGNFSTITLTFNKNIARVAPEGKAVALTNTTTGRVSKFTICSASTTTNKRLGVISFDQQPNGNYIFTLPQDVFFDASGNGNAPLSLSFSIKGSKIADWELPTYNNIVATPANNSTVNVLSEVNIALSRTGYTQPMQLYINTTVAAAKVKEVYKEGVNYNDPDVLPDIESEDIKGAILTIEDGQLKVRFSEPIREAARVVIGIPGKAVINLNTRENTPAKTLYEKGGCTNAPLQFTIIVKPSSPTALEATEATEPLNTKDIFTTDGKRVSTLQPGVNIIHSTNANGEVRVRKVIVK